MTKTVTLAEEAQAAVKMLRERAKYSGFRTYTDGFAKQDVRIAELIEKLSFDPSRQSSVTGIIEVSGQLTKRDRQRLQSAFKKGVKEGRRIEREAAKKGETR